MSRLYQAPAHARGWLLLSVAAISLPQLVVGPLWQTGLLVLVLGWRFLIDRQRLRVPRRWLRLLLLLATVVATWHSFGLLYGPRAGTALITSLFALKYLELTSKRDAYVLIVLGYFVCATILLFYRGVGPTLYVAACLLLLTAGLVGINYDDSHARRRQHLLVAASMLAQALPLAVALFLLVPRIAPFWDFSLDVGQARSGVSDRLSPGGITRLVQSRELAFRVQFDGPVPPPSARYWRGLTYSYFDGTSWRQAAPRHWNTGQLLYHGSGVRPAWYQDLQRARQQADGRTYRYQVIMEPSRQRWLYALVVPFARLHGLGLARDMRLVADHDIERTFSYRVVSVPSARRAMPMTAAERRLMLQLPAHIGPRARQLAHHWRQRYPDDAELVRAALRYFHDQPFYYTLDPPLLRGDTIDTFLFDSRRGFCEHYASSFTFLMRAAGIPARVVGGYQGGEMNAGKYLQVHQYDAHAWSEVWLPERGWVRADPTAQVAPERVEAGLRAALVGQGDDAAARAIGGQRWPVLFRLRQWGDYVDFHWQKWVIGYRHDQQQRLLGQLLGSVTPLRIALALLVTLAGCLALLALLVLWRCRPDGPGPLQRDFWRLHRALLRRGLPIGTHLSAAQLEQHVVRRWPRASRAAARWRRLFESLAYRRVGPPDRRDLARLRHRRRALLRHLRRPAR